MPMKFLMLLILDASYKNTKLCIIAHHNNKKIHRSNNGRKCFRVLGLVLHTKWNEKYLSSLKYAGIQIDDDSAIHKSNEKFFSAIFVVSL